MLPIFQNPIIPNAFKFENIGIVYYMSSAFLFAKTVYVWFDEFQPVQDVRVVRLRRSSPRDRTTPNPFYLLDGTDSGKRRLLNPFVS